MARLAKFTAKTAQNIGSFGMTEPNTVLGFSEVDWVGASSDSRLKELPREHPAKPVKKGPLAKSIPWTDLGEAFARVTNLRSGEKVDLKSEMSNSGCEGLNRLGSPASWRYVAHILESAYLAGWNEKPKPKAKAKPKATEEPKRARTKSGHFIADDPNTKPKNEAWVGGKAPKKSKAKAKPKGKKKS